MLKLNQTYFRNILEDLDQSLCEMALTFWDEVPKSPTNWSMTNLYILSSSSSRRIFAGISKKPNNALESVPGEVS
ncbi:hypothetical protein [Bacillus cereus group sp. FL70]|uniref:hypothetical protein n=1 Tax=Bacillus cereus group sp. FL70 TaxID=3040254 RepID=UPI0033951414